MKKILVNEKFGGYDFSNKATLEYLNRKHTKGISFHCVKRDKITDKLIYPEISEKQYLVQDLQESDSYIYGAHIQIDGKKFEPQTISRTDPVAIQIVEELGSEFVDACSSHLVVYEYDETIDCIIVEYDGFETIKQSEPCNGKAPDIYHELVTEDQLYDYEDE